jgi:hypothetical protein
VRWGEGGEGRGGNIPCLRHTHNAEGIRTELQVVFKEVYGLCGRLDQCIVNHPHKPYAYAGQCIVNHPHKPYA